MKTGKDRHDSPRRGFLRGLGAAAGVIALDGCSSPGNGARAKAAGSAHAQAEEAEVTPGEDLMQEHGVLERVLLVYDEAARRIERSEPLPPEVLTNAAGIIRRFVEQYHEEQEEKFVFPRLEAAEREVELVAILRRQHRRGREVTDAIVKASTRPATPELVGALRAFVRMYRPHAAREDTVLFPAFRGIVGGAAYRELGEQFEENEHARFGEHGFEHAVGQVAGLEAALGIGDLASFTP